MDLNYKLMGKRIKELRLAKSLTQEILAEKIGLSSVYVSHIESGSTKSSLETLVKIANALETTPDYLLMDSVYEAKEQIKDEIAVLLNKCCPNDLRLISDMIKVIIEHNTNQK